MPNAANVDSPIVLVGAGRSGTSLVSKVFDLHPDCVGVGETANLIFGPWQAVALSSASIAPLVEQHAWVSEDERAARVVRQTFLTCFPDDKRHWMQKPIGVPKAVTERFPDVGSADAGAWYWKVMRSSFPGARYIAILRHPCDVVLSGRSRWGFAESSLWRTIATLGGYLLHTDSPVECVVHYEDLVARPEATVRRLCDAAAIPFRPEMLAGFDEVHVAAPGREDPSQTGYSRRGEWATLDPGQLLPAARDVLTAVFARFGGCLDWPEHFTRPAIAAHASTTASSPTDAEMQRLRAQVAQLSTSVERAMFDHAEELRRRDEAWQRREHAFAAREDAAGQRWHEREAEATRLWEEQQAWIAELEKVKVWFEQQVAYWRAAAEKNTKT